MQASCTRLLVWSREKELNGDKHREGEKLDSEKIKALRDTLFRRTPLCGVHGRNKEGVRAGLVWLQMHLTTWFVFVFVFFHAFFSRRKRGCGGGSYKNCSYCSLLHFSLMENIHFLTQHLYRNKLM